VSRGLRAQLERTAADAVRDVQLSNDSNYNVALSPNNETRNSSSYWVPNATGSITAPEDDGASWSDGPSWSGTQIDCRHFDSPGCPGAPGKPLDPGATAEPQPDLPETSTLLRGEDSSSNVFSLVVAGYGTCAVVGAGFWLHRCRRKRKKARVMSSYSSTQDDEDHADRKPESKKHFRSIIDSNDLKLIDAKHWRRRPPMRAPSDTSSVASDGRSDEIFDSADEQRWELAPEEKVVPGSRVQVTMEGSKQMGRIGTRCLSD